MSSRQLVALVAAVIIGVPRRPPRGRAAGRRLGGRPPRGRVRRVGRPERAGRGRLRDLPRRPAAVRGLGGRGELRAGVEASCPLRLAPVLLRPLGVDERGLALGLRRALGLGRVPLRPVGVRSVLRVAVGAGLRVGARVGVVARVRRRDRVVAPRPGLLGLRLLVPLHRLLVDLRPERPVRVRPRLLRRLRAGTRPPLVRLDGARARAASARRRLPARSGRAGLGRSRAAPHRAADRSAGDARAHRPRAVAGRARPARRDPGVPARAERRRGAVPGAERSAGTRRSSRAGRVWTRRPQPRPRRRRHQRPRRAGATIGASAVAAEVGALLRAAVGSSRRLHPHRAGATIGTSAAAGAAEVGGLPRAAAGPRSRRRSRAATAAVAAAMRRAPVVAAASAGSRDGGRAR